MVSCELAFKVVGPAEVVLQLMAASATGRVVAERFEVRTEGGPVRATAELTGSHGARVQVVRSLPGHLTISYPSEVGSKPSPTGNGGVSATSPVPARSMTRQRTPCSPGWVPAATSPTRGWRPAGP